MQNVITNNNQHSATTMGHFTASQKEKIINLIMKFNGGDDYMPAKKKENFTTGINNNIVNGINNSNNVDNSYNNNNNNEQHQHQQQLFGGNIDTSNTNSYYHDINNNEMEIDEDSCSLSSSSTHLRYNAGNSSNNNNKIFRIDKGIRHKYSIDCLYKKTSNTFMNNYFHNNQIPPSPNTNRIYEEMKSFFTKPQHSVTTATTTKNGIMMLSKRPRFNSSASASIDINFLDNKNFQDKPSPNPLRNSFNSTDKHSISNTTNTNTKLISNPFLLEFDTTEIKEDFDNENCNIFEEHLSPY
jgi:hypothetical protein